MLPRFFTLICMASTSICHCFLLSNKGALWKYGSKSYLDIRLETLDQHNCHSVPSANHLFLLQLCWIWPLLQLHATNGTSASPSCYLNAKTLLILYDLLHHSYPLILEFCPKVSTHIPRDFSLFLLKARHTLLSSSCLVSDSRKIDSWWFPFHINTCDPSCNALYQLSSRG